MQKGDKNSRYFHAVIRKRQRRNRILLLEGEVNDLDGINALVVDYYRELLRTTIYLGSVDQSVVDLGPKVPDSLHVFLVAEVTKEEIRAIVWSIGDLKAVEPDGLNAFFFFKHSWHLVKTDVVGVVIEFFQS